MFPHDEPSHVLRNSIGVILATVSFSMLCRMIEHLVLSMQNPGWPPFTIAFLTTVVVSIHRHSFLFWRLVSLPAILNWLCQVAEVVICMTWLFIFAEADFPTSKTYPLLKWDFTLTQGLFWLASGLTAVFGLIAWGLYSEGPLLKTIPFVKAEPSHPFGFFNPHRRILLAKVLTALSIFAMFVDWELGDTGDAPFFVGLVITFVHSLISLTMDSAVPRWLDFVFLSAETSLVSLDMNSFWTSLLCLPLFLVLRFVLAVRIWDATVLEKTLFDMRDSSDDQTKADEVQTLLPQFDYSSLRVKHKQAVNV
ncbi:hypothetical protein DL96DRAFT_1615102 [Flagelloscypha sp. PMI_526]|nr:hypothetical protein DL96DRAFT_1615102 [Flagelloscypha sp. PMI_526]